MSQPASRFAPRARRRHQRSDDRRRRLAGEAEHDRHGFCGSIAVVQSVTPVSGVPSLDHALGGLYWGDNVVWELDEDVSLEPFVAALASKSASFDGMAYVAMTDNSAPPELELIDARDGSALAQPQALLDAVRGWCAANPRSFVLFDPLETMAARWGDQTARRFFQRACPLLLELGAIAYWSLAAGGRTRELRRTVEEITQCILVLGDGRLRVAKADGRPPGVQGSVYTYAFENGTPTLSPAEAATRVGAALRNVRAERNVTQTELARAAGISPSAISQAERGRRGLSVDTLLRLADRLGMTLDELLRGSHSPGYRLGRRDHPRTQGEEAILPLLDDPRAGLRVYLVSLPVGGSAESSAVHKGLESVAVASGLVQVILGAERTVLRRGEAMLAGSSGVTGWRNLGDSRALVFWTLRDDPPPG
jgi:transcriptional regulator with XRE-family HTH domain